MDKRCFALGNETCRKTICTSKICERL